MSNNIFTDFMEDDHLDGGEYIPLLSKADEDKMNEQVLPEAMPILTLRNTVLFPGVVLPITISRDKSIQLINEVYRGDKLVGIVSQKDNKVENPLFEDLYEVGTLAEVLKVLRMPDGSTTTIIQGKKKFKIQNPIQTDPYLKAEIIAYNDTAIENDAEFEALISSVKDVATQIIKQSPNLPSEAIIGIQNIDSHTFLLNFIASNMNAPVLEKQAVLEIADLKARAIKLLEMLNQEFALLQLKNEIQSKVKTDLDQQQREYFLNQQLKQIQEELGGNPSEELIADFQERAKAKKWSISTADAFNKELDRLKRINPNAPDYSVQTSYLELILDLPWESYTEDNFDLKRATEILDRDHFGLTKVKKRVLEYLAVLKLKNDMKSPILCLFGPPGVGKTSLGRSIADALGRKYARVALGGLRDEAEIRGHRKTYIGAMPGRIIQNIKKVNSSNPVFILDEIDKLGNDFRGDPSSALLEVLDPEQNNSFHDNYLDLDYDLSKVIFIATANSLNNIPTALMDRMEIIEINGYTAEEKIEIAKAHLIDKQMKEHGVTSLINITDSALNKIVTAYTKESGVRGLDKKIAQVARFIAKSIAMEEEFPNPVDLEHVKLILGTPVFEREKGQTEATIGVVNGLAWTSVGGEVLFIETNTSKGKGKLSITGNLGDVMKESTTLALAYIKSKAETLNIAIETLENTDIHLHVPEGATPKDGPSAGITIFTALVSVLRNKKVRSDVAMTGEITLRGKVLPVGGIKEKILAAKRLGINTIVLSKMNQKDIDDIEPLYLDGLQFHFIEKMEEALVIALV